MHKTLVEALSSSTLTPRDVRQLSVLLKKLAPKSGLLSEWQVHEILKRNAIFVARVGRSSIVGMATLITYWKLSGQVGIVEDVIVLDEFQGQGIGRALVEEIVRTGRARKLKHISLTSNFARTTAHGLYRKAGFVVKPTVYFRLVL